MSIKGWFDVQYLEYERNYSERLGENFVAVNLGLKNAGSHTVVYCPDNPRAVGFWRKYLEMVLGEDLTWCTERAGFSEDPDDLDGMENYWHRWPVPDRVKLKESAPSSKTGKTYINIVDMEFFQDKDEDGVDHGGNTRMGNPNADGYRG